MLLQLLLLFGIHSVCGTLGVDREFNSSFLLGGNRIDRAVAVVTSDDGSVYLGGHTQGDGFPTLDAIQIPTDFSRKAFITVYGPGGDMRFSTTFGGDRIDELRGIAVTQDGSKVYLVGITTSTAMNTTTGIPNGGGSQDCFIGIIDVITKRVVFSTFFGGNSTDDCQKIVINEPSGKFFVAGNTQSGDFPGISARLGNYEEAFVSIFDLAGNLLRTIIFSGHGFDTISDIAVDSILTSWTLYVAGYTNSDNFPTTVNNTLRQGYDGWFGVLNDSGIIYVNLLGGSNTDRIYGISVDQDNIYLTGESSSIYSFPIVGNTLQTNVTGQSDAFVSVVRRSDFQILYSSFIGGSQQDRANSIVSDSSKNIYIVGFTASNDYPSAGNAYSTSYFGGSYDGFLSIINWQEGTLIYSSFIGGNTTDQLNRVHVRSGSVFLAGYSDSLNYPSSVPLKGSEDATLTIVSTVDIISSSALPTVTTDITVGISTQATTGSSPSPCGLCLESQELVVQFENDSPTFKMNQISETKTDNQYVEVIWNELIEKDVSSSVIQQLTIPKTGWQITPLTRTTNGVFSVQNVNFTITLENNATLKISNYLYEVEATISYGSYQLPVSPKKNKITVELWNWPFSNPKNTLSSNILFNADSPIISRDVQDVDSFMKSYTVSTTTLKMGVDIINFALIDDQQKGVESQWEGTQLTISFPSFEYLYYDPDFAVLVQGSKELQDPSSSSSGPNTLPWVLGALAFSFILMLVLLVGIFLYLKHIRKHKLRGTLNNHVSERFSQVHLTPLSKRYDSDGSSVSISSSVSSDDGRISQSSEGLV